MKPRKNTLEELDAVRARIQYDPETGLLTRQGQPAGWIGNHGYRELNVSGKRYLAHRVAFALMAGRWPTEFIDHINCVRTDNRWVNLREADHRQNVLNTAKTVRNTSGFKGVHYEKANGKWSAATFINGAQHRLGQFNTPEEAHAAYVKAVKREAGEFARWD